MAAVYAFGSFVVDPVKRTLCRDGRPVPITSKTFDVLVVLLEQRDHVVSKDELLNRVWPNTAVNENNLARQVSSLRRVLGQRPDEHDFIVTVPGHGYRFVAAVRDLTGGQAEPSGVEGRRAGEVATDPVAAEAPPTDPVAPASASARRTPLAAAAAVAACALLATVVVTVRLWPEPDPPPRRGLQRITYEAPALPRDAAWGPDGQWVVYASDRAGNADLWKQRLGDPDPVRLTTSEVNETQPQWSPDGRSIAFRSERDGGGLHLIQAGGGAERRLTSFGYEPRWSPDGTQILFKRSEVLPGLPTIYVVGLDGKPPRPVRPDVLGKFKSLHAAWHPDGRVSVWGTIGDGEPTFQTVPLEGGEATTADMSARVRQDLASVAASRFVWAASRRYIYFEGLAGETGNVWRITVDPVSGKWVDGPERLTTGAGHESTVALSPDGTRIVFTSTSSRTRLWAFPLDAANGRAAGEPEAITQGSTGEVDFDVRSDGSKVVYRAVRAGRHELWERSLLEGRERLLLASTDVRLAKPLWSPDGARLAFLRCAARDNTAAVAVLNTDGSGARVLTSPERVEMQGSDWVKDGSAILGSCRFGRAERYSTCLVPVPGANTAGDPAVRVIASDPKWNLFNQRFSPNQRWIAFLAHDLLYAATSTVYVIPAAGGPWRAITDGASFDDKPRWGPDGKILYFVSNRGGIANVWARRFDDALGTPVGEPFPVTSFRSAQFVLTPQTVQMDIAVTATHLLLPMTESRSEIWMLSEVDR